MGCRGGTWLVCRRKGNEWHARTARVMAADERFASLPAGAAADLAGEPLPQSFDTWLADLPDSLLEVVARLAEAGAGVWVVGGSVRDACAGLTAHDDDLATTMRPDQMLALFPTLCSPTKMSTGHDFPRGGSVSHSARVTARASRISSARVWRLVFGG